MMTKKEKVKLIKVRNGVSAIFENKEIKITPKVAGKDFIIEEDKQYYLSYGEEEGKFIYKLEAY